MKKTKIYAENLDYDTMQQFESAMEQDFAIEGALMPDTHKGYTLPIGAVVAAKGVVVPAWVGYDIGCTDKDTEFLSPTGWVKISEYNGEDILTYDETFDTCDFLQPVRHIIKPCEEFYHLDNATVDQMVNEEHTMLLFSSKNEHLTISDSAANLVEKNRTLSKGVNHKFKTTLPASYEQGQGVSLTDDEISLVLAIAADGCIRNTGKVEFHLKKQRKIDRLKRLLECLGIVFNIYDMKDDTWGCSFSWGKATKSLDIFWGANSKQLAHIAEEVFFWDGHHKSNGTKTFSTTCKASADLVQYACSSSDIRTNIQEIDHKDKPNWNKGYTVYTTKNPFVGFPKDSDIKVVKSEDGLCYCFTTETGYWVMRRNGKIVITGNCGMAAVKLSIKGVDITPFGEQIAEEIYKRVPVGNSKHKQPKKYNTARLSDVGKTIADNRGALHQIGTLGGGNHFIEVGADENDDVWIVCHSGSRGTGHGIAGHYMKLAAESSGLKMEDHNPLRDDSLRGKNYINDLEWCLDYAINNRHTMITQVSNSIEAILGVKVYQEMAINRNHNHAEQRADGLWIHRKGATHAEEGMLGVIPGNMRDGSFIVRGKGNEDSLQSSSHGAGRVLGRYKAKKVLSVEDFADTMVGIVAKVGAGTLDESPMAYKDIFEVMRLQEDLVEVITHVKPIINIKG